MKVGCRLKSWRSSATSNAGTPVSAAAKLRGFKLEERKRNKEDGSLNRARTFSVDQHLPTKEKERGRG